MSFSTTGFLQETLSSKHVDKISRLFLSRKNEVKETKVKVVADSFAVWSRPRWQKQSRSVWYLWKRRFERTIYHRSHELQ